MAKLIFQQLDLCIHGHEINYKTVNAYFVCRELQYAMTYTWNGFTNDTDVAPSLTAGREGEEDEKGTEKRMGKGRQHILM